MTLPEQATPGSVRIRALVPLSFLASMPICETQPLPVMSVLGALWTRSLVSMTLLSSWWLTVLARQPAGAPQGGDILADLVAELGVGDGDQRLGALA